MRTFAIALVLASVAMAAPALADVPAPVGAGSSAGATRLLWSAERIEKVKKQIGIHESRAAALQPILARDTAARDSVAADAEALDAVAKAEASQAAEYSAMAATATDEKQKAEFLAFARQLERFSKQSDESAKTHRQLSRTLSEQVRQLDADVKHHLTAAARLKTLLANNS